MENIVIKLFKNPLDIFHIILRHLYTKRVSAQISSVGKNLCFIPSLYTFLGGEYMELGDDVTIGKDVQLTCWNVSKNTPPHLRIGNNCNIRAWSHISCVKSICIGDNLLTGTNVLISDNSHGEITIENMQIPPKKREIYSKGGITIGNNVWLGNNVCVLGGVSIGDGVVVAANSVVTHDIPPYCVAAGAPAKVIKNLI